MKFLPVWLPFWIRLIGFLVTIIGLIILFFFYFGVFQKRSISSIFERVASGYGLIALGLLIISLGFWIDHYKIKWITKLFKLLGKEQYIIYLIVALIFIFLAGFEYRKSIKEMNIQ